jgi:hypothetical protein
MPIKTLFGLILAVMLNIGFFRKISKKIFSMRALRNLPRNRDTILPPEIFFV